MPTISDHSQPAQKMTASVILAFACVYFFWGSTYAAIGIGTQYMPSLLLCGIRFFTAGCLLLTWSKLRGVQITWPPKVMLRLAIIGILLLGGGNLGVVYAEKILPSGLAALMIAAVPIYIAILEMVLPGGEPLSGRGWSGVLFGFAGLATLLWPDLRNSLSGDQIHDQVKELARILAIGVVLAGALSWAVGSVVSRRSRLTVNSFVAAGWQMVFAGIFSLGIGTALHQWPAVQWNYKVYGSLAYLITGGSLIGYTSFVYLLEHVSVSKSATYAYVNPVIAVLIGIIVLHEHPEWIEFVGMAGIIFAVFLINTAKHKAPAQSSVDPELTVPKSDANLVVQDLAQAE